MAIDFPDSPNTNDTFTSGDKTWTYDGVKWSITTAIAATKDLDELDDVTITSPSTNEILSYDGSGWVNSSAPESGTTAQKGSNMMTYLVMEVSP